MFNPTRVPMRERIAILLPAVVFMGGCAMLELTDAGAGVQLVKPDAVASCASLGRLTASVIHEVGFLPRHPDAVQANINVTARNSAAGMGADAIVPASGVQDGKQTFEVYRCARR